MAGRELAIRKEGNLNLREVAARATLRDIQVKGHVYVELRQVGKRPIFFCTLCLAQCFNDSVLFDHLGGNLHARRYAAAKLTLFGPVPWPFSDGVLFFGNSHEKDNSFVCSDSGSDMALVVRDASDGVDVNGEEVTSNANGHSNSNDERCNPGRTNGSSICEHDVDGYPGTELLVNGHGKPLRCYAGVGMDKNYDKDICMTIPGVLYKDEISNLNAQFIGFGHIASRVYETNGIGNRVGKIWCAWLGEGSSEENDLFLKSPKCDFGIVIFSYTYDLGRKWTLDEPKLLLSPGSCSEVDDGESPGKRGKKSFSDPEDSCAASSEDCSGVHGCTSNGSHEHQVSRCSSNKALRKELRKQKRLAAERMCDICGQPMLPEKDVGTLLNLKTGKLACSSRNTNGAFHLFHASCLIHWILLCETEIWADQSTKKKTTRRRKRKIADKNGISSVLCPECQGTGIYTVGEELEKPSISLSEMFLYKLKTIEAHKAWMKNPEVLQKCSTGLHFPSDSADNVQLQENVVPLNLLYFYRLEELCAEYMAGGTGEL
ncbi:beta-beta-alpha zinc fingers domain-containing protein [Dioscorea alata]|uniref:Beta-beta-alpha zinc fingers domain-containing protein n=1 Tax=Dioscorea alata TaxID=55571 RepID=A0ACB7UUR0_DIOAL|nr:beta-beta-alpha zinc fingers domain-containing protein [Dioscorea alata]